MNMEQSIHTHDSSFDDFVKKISLPKESLFVVDVDLWPIYLESFPEGEERQYHNCNSCKKFIQNYGSLVIVEPETGRTISAVWDESMAPVGYACAFASMRISAEKAPISKLFLSSDKMLGTPITGEWTHFAALNPSVHAKSFMTAGQAAAEKKEDYRNVSRALGEFKLGTLEQVVELLQSDSLYRSEKVLGQAEWLFNLKALTACEKHQQRRKNIVWKAIADAPSGFCHPRSSMIGTLLDDLQNGLSFDRAAERFKAKMHPLQYQRPSAEPTTGAILAGEKRVEELGARPSLERKYATLSDIETIWTPKELEETKEGGVFDHLKKDAVNTIAAVAGRITWTKFSKDVLPKAKKIEVWIDRGRSQYRTFLTALDPEAPIIFQWDNTVSWYHWHHGSLSDNYGLTLGWVDVDAICLPPYMWGGNNLTHYGNEVSFIIHGARESKNEGNAIFPETLKSEFHSIRSVIEAHSKRTRIHDIDGPHVVGLGLGSKIRVHTSVVTEYVVDRWD